MTAGTSSVAFTVIGLLLSVAGVVLLFRFGMPYRVRRNGAELLIMSYNPAHARTERRYNALGWLGLALLITGGVLQIIGATTMPPVSWAMNSTPEFWTALLTALLAIATAVLALATGGLVMLACRALRVAKGQLDTVKTERTVKLIKEASGPKMEAILGFFDYAADNRVSREAFSALFQRLVKARPAAIANSNVPDVAAAAKEAEPLILQELKHAITDTTPLPTDIEIEAKLRERILTATNFFERVYTLLESKAIDETMFLGDQDYSIVAVYYTLAPILDHLMGYEAFNFDNFTDLAKRAQPYLASWLKPDDHPLRKATFAKLGAVSPKSPDAHGGP